MDLNDLNCQHLNEKGEDNRLNNWIKWLEIRKKFHDRMYQILLRRPSELCLNSGDNFRKIREERLLQECANIPCVDAYRGSPNFFFLPPASRKFPSLISVRTKQFDYEVPEIDFVNVPLDILREKNVLTSEDKKLSKWYQNEYLKEKRKELEIRINQIIPHIPEGDDIIVTGNGPEEESILQVSPLKDPDSDVVSVVRFNDDASIKSIHSAGSMVGETPIKSLQIDDAVFTANGKQEIKQYTFFVEYEIGKDDIVYKTITFKNVGNVVLKYFWYRRFSENVLENNIPHRLSPFAFIFKKNESLILPNETVEFKISFKTNKPGVYKEIWELRTEPTIFEGEIIKGEFCLLLYGCADIANFAESEAAILSRIEDGIKYTTVDDILLEILNRVQKNIVDPLAFLTKAPTKKDMFEAINAEFGQPGTLPAMYHYDECLVKKLEYMYGQLKTSIDPPKWNFKISEIGRLIDNCKTIEEYNYYKFSFNEIVNKLFKTNMIINEEREKYQCVYDLVCIMVDKMSERIYKLRKHYRITLTEKYPEISKEILLEQEELDDNCRSYLFCPDVTIKNAFERIKECIVQEFEEPPMEQLKLLPFQNVDEKYKIYYKEKYNIDVDAVSSVKGKNGKDKKGKGKKDDKKKDKKDKKGKKDKKDKKGDKSSKGSIKEPKKYPVRKESVLQLKSLTELLPAQVTVTPDYLNLEETQELAPNNVDLYKYNLYMSVYILLRKTVEQIEVILEHKQVIKQISRQVLRNCIDLGIPTLPPSESEDVSQHEFKKMLDSIYDQILLTSVSGSTICSRTDSSESFKTKLTDISKSYSGCTEEFLKPISSKINIVKEEIEMVDAWTETDNVSGELFALRTKSETMQTEEVEEDFDLVAKIERELSATSVQYMQTPKEDRSTQVDLCTDCTL